MPVFLDLRFLDAAVGSILAQSYRDLELILVDDGTGSPDVFIRQAQRDPRIRLVVSPVNLGLMGALRLGIRYSSGAIIARIDADDIAAPSRIARQVAALDLDPELGMVGTNFVKIDETGVLLDVNRMPETDIDIRWTIHFCNPFCHPSVAFRRTSYDAAGGYDETWRAEIDGPKSGTASGDHEFWFRLLAQCRARNLQDALLQYRVNSRGVSMTHSTDWRKRTDALRAQAWARLGVTYDAAIAFQLAAFVLGHPISDEALRAPAYRVCLSLLRRFLTMSAPLACPGDDVFGRRLAQETIERMLADQAVDLRATVDAEDWAWSQTFLSGGNPARRARALTLP